MPPWRAVTTPETSTGICSAWLFSRWSAGFPFCTSTSAAIPNVIYTIFLGVLAVRIRRSPRLCSAWKVLLILLLLILTVPADWGCTGVVIILVFDYYYGNWKHQAFAYCMVVMLDMGVLSLLTHPFFGLFYDHVFQIDWELFAYSIEDVGAFLPLLLLSRYTGRHGTSGGFSKWFFYMFYPLHLLVLGWLRAVL